MDRIQEMRELIGRLLEHSEVVRMIGAAPEIENGMMVGEAARERGITASVAHSDASFEVAEQALRYNSVLKVRFIFLTNGKNTYIYKSEGAAFKPMDRLPLWEEMKG